MRFFSESEVRRLLPLPECIALLRQAFERLANGEAVNQPRRRLALPGGSVLHSMAAGDGGFFGTKIYSTHSRHGAHFLFLLFRNADAQPLAMFEANYLGQIRTGAASGLATNLLARPGAQVLGLIGTGFQARSQVEAMMTVRPIREARVWSRSADRSTAFAGECARQFGIAVQPAASAEQAVRGADIVITATSARDPVLEAGWVMAGAHVNAIGSNQASRRELPSDLLRKAGLIVVDSLEQARMECGDLLLGLDDWGGVAELADVVTGKRGRQTPDEVTIFESQGLAIEDVASAAYVFQHGETAGIGRDLPFLYS
jgi:ornithine cyclodeaminase/alanine dehydrogenase-like protein (mu-crystallin family)